MLPVVAELTTAFVAPKYTILPAATLLKFLPVIVIGAPTGPDIGETEVMTGGFMTVAGVGLFRKIEKLLLPWFTETISGFPSPSISTAASPVTLVPAVRSSLLSKKV